MNLKYSRAAANFRIRIEKLELKKPYHPVPKLAAKSTARLLPLHKFNEGTITGQEEPNDVWEIEELYKNTSYQTSEPITTVCVMSSKQVLISELFRNLFQF